MDRSGVTPCSVPRGLFSGRLKEREKEKESACEVEGGRRNEKGKRVLRAPLHAAQFPIFQDHIGPRDSPKFANCQSLPLPGAHLSAEKAHCVCQVDTGGCAKGVRRPGALTPPLTPRAHQGARRRTPKLPHAIAQSCCSQSGYHHVESTKSRH